MKCKDCRNLSYENYGACYCDVLFKLWAAGKSSDLPYVNKNSECKLKQGGKKNGK